MIVTQARRNVAKFAGFIELLRKELSAADFLGNSATHNPELPVVLQDCVRSEAYAMQGEVKRCIPKPRTISLLVRIFSLGSAIKL